jgi:hypothetical protein
VTGRRFATCALALATAVLAVPAEADRRYARSARQAHLAAALQAVRALGGERGALDQALHTGARRRCRSDVTAPSLSCLIDMARTHCDGEAPARRASCHAAADVVLTNLLAESELVDQATRARLVGQGRDYRAAMRVELAQRHAALAAEMALSQPGPEAELPARIDRFCAGRERALAWQRCVAAIVWYIGSHERAPDRGGDVR